MSIDTLSNILSSIKNAALVGKTNVEVPYTVMGESVLKVIKEAGFIGDIKVFKESGTSFKKINVELAYDEFEKPLFKEMKRVSKPGHRVYKNASELGRYLNGYGIQVVSTSRGVMAGVAASYKKLGGEVICQVS